MAKKSYLSGVAAMAITAAIFSAANSAKAREISDAEDITAWEGVAFQSTRASVPEVPLSEATYQIVDEDPHLMSPEMRRVAAGAALSALLAGFVGLFGFSRALEVVTTFLKTAGKAAGKAAKTVAVAPVKAAKVAAKATGALMAGPGKWIMIIAGLSIFAMTGVAHFDLQWQAGALLGAGVTGAAIYGFGKTVDASKAVGRKTTSLAQKMIRKPVPAYATF